MENEIIKEVSNGQIKYSVSVDIRDTEMVGKIYSIADFIKDKVNYLKHDCGQPKSDIRVLMPKTLIGIFDTNSPIKSLDRKFPITFCGVEVSEHYKYEVVVYSIYFEKNETELVQILNL